MLRIWMLSLVCFCGAAACSSKEEENSKKKDNEEPEVQSLRDAPFPAGVAIAPNSLRNIAAYRELVIREASTITAENAMKPGNISKGRGEYFWDDVDYLIDFAQTNNMRLHGHCLVWYRQSVNSMPAWIQNFSGTKEEWKAIMREYILAVVGHCKGKVASWDVVNEAIADDGSFRGSTDVWCTNIGAPEYIDWAFRCAHEADPDALLFYNDYGHEYSAVKRTATNNLIRGMQERGVPVHGVGLQMHTNTNRSLQDLRTAIRTAAETGLKVHVSELDVSVNQAGAADVTFTEELQNAQFNSYMMVSSEMARLPQEQQHGITTWGVRDLETYGYPDWPLLFDKDFNRKKAYDGLYRGFSE
ncbi:MAG: endo-1,4-beta-xylanase [Bacteroidales bacterium]|nr:endo-1,4-beta-xylanase [Bacteroidales bacterium]